MVDKNLAVNHPGGGPLEKAKDQLRRSSLASTAQTQSSPDTPSTVPTTTPPSTAPASSQQDSEASTKNPTTREQARVIEVDRRRLGDTPTKSTSQSVDETSSSYLLDPISAASDDTITANTQIEFSWVRKTAEKQQPVDPVRRDLDPPHRRHSSIIPPEHVGSALRFHRLPESFSSHIPSDPSVPRVSSSDICSGMDALAMAQGAGGPAPRHIAQEPVSVSNPSWITGVQPASPNFGYGAPSAPTRSSWLDRQGLFSQELTREEANRPAFPPSILGQNPLFGSAPSAAPLPELVASRRPSWAPVTDNIFGNTTDQFALRWRHNVVGPGQAPLSQQPEAGPSHRFPGNNPYLLRGNNPDVGKLSSFGIDLPKPPGIFSSPPYGQYPLASPPSSSSSSSPNDRVFRPMESRALKPVSELEAYDLMVKGFSPNYRGNPDLERNRSAAIPPDANCSLFITGLAPDLTTHTLLASIRDAGRIYATHINGPEPNRGHATCAAKVVFFERIAAERFYERFKTTGFTVAGRPFHVGHVVWNRIRSAEVDVGGRKTRVLLISGPPAVVNETALCKYFASKIQFQIDEVRKLRQTTISGTGAAGGITGGSTGAITVGTGTSGTTGAITCGNGIGTLTGPGTTSGSSELATRDLMAVGEDRALVEFRFGSYRCQAESARMALSRECKELGVYCEFGRDPCDVVQDPREQWNAQA